MRTRWMTVAIAAFLSPCLALVAKAGTPINETIAADSRSEISVENLSGSVTVNGWDRNEVQVRGTLAREAKELRVEADEEDVEIRVVLPRRVEHVEDTHLEILIPEGAEIRVETVSATVDLDEVIGSVRVETVSGDVTVQGGPESVDVETVSGGIEILGVRENVEAQSVSGFIRVEGGEEIEAATTSGRIEITGDLYRAVQATSVSGSITFDGVPDRDGEFEFENFSGAVELYLPADVDGEFEIETFSGKIRSDFDGRVHTPKHGPGASMRFGRSDTRFTINTFSGSIHLRAR